MTVYEKLMQVQQRLKAPKSQYNKFGDFYYRSCEDIQEAAKPILAEVKAVLLVSDEVVQVGSRFYIKATAKFQDTESPDSITNSAYARESEEKPKMDVAQVTGSCSSYARKYALNGLFCIDDAKDPDCTQGVNAVQMPQRQQKPKQQKPKAGKAELDRLREEAGRTGTDLSKVCARYLVDRIEDLSPEQYQRAMSAFRKMETVPLPATGGRYAFGLSEMENEMPFR